MTRHHLLAVICLALLPSIPVVAEDAVADGQSVLAAQGFYFGKVDGRMNEETRAALKRFQIRAGLPVTGEMDAASLRELAKKPPEAAPTDSPESVREISRNQEKSDRDFLLQTETAEREGKVDPAPPRPAQAPAEPTVRPPTAQDTRASEPARPTGAEVRRYIESYLQAAEAPTPDKEISFYADRVDYFDSGRVSRQFVRNDQLKYYRRWPERNFELLGEPHVEWIDAQRAAVRFKLRFNLSGESKRAQGVTENLVHLEIHENGMVIIGIRERRLKD